MNEDTWELHARVLRIQIRIVLSIAETERGHRILEQLSSALVQFSFSTVRQSSELSDNEGRWKDHRIGGRRPVFSDLFGHVDHKMSELDEGVSRIPPNPNIL